MPRDATDILGITTGGGAKLLISRNIAPDAQRHASRCHRHAGYNNGAVRSRLSRGTLQSVNSVLQ